MKQSEHDGGLTVRAIAGTHTVILGMDLAPAVRVGCLGFAIQRTDVDVGTSAWLPNRLSFPTSATKTRDFAVEEPVDFGIGTSAAPAPVAPPIGTTLDAPWQSFRFIDSGAEPGRRYRYRVVARRGSWDALVDGPLVDVVVSTEDPRSPATAVFFNRAAASSQSYRERFGDMDPEALPAPQGAAARAWLSRGLEEGLLAFLDQAKGPRDALHVAVYEFQKPELLHALVAAQARGVDVRAVYHYRRKGDDDHTWTRNAEAAKHANLRNCSQRQADPKSAISHNKFVVLLRDGAPIAVWTGSTNWTDGALYGQLNVGHGVYDGKVASAFEQYFNLLAEDTPRALLTERLAAMTDVAAVRAAVLDRAAVRGVWPIFSPQRTLAAIELYADLCARARHVMVCAPFELHETIREQLTGGARAGTLRHVLLDREGNLGDDELVDQLDGGSGTEVSVAVRLKEPLHTFQKRLLAGAEHFHHRGVHLHAKLILLDPLGDDPVVVTGSANYSNNSTTDNDENTLVIRGDTAVADIYATEFMRMFDSYHFRGRSNVAVARGRTLGLAPDDRWSERYYADDAHDHDRSTTRRLFAGTL